MVDTKKKEWFLQNKEKRIYNKPVLLYHSAKNSFQNFMVKKKSPAINLYFYSKNSDIIIVYFHQTKHISKKKNHFFPFPMDKCFYHSLFFSIIFSAIGEL